MKEEVPRGVEASRGIDATQIAPRITWLSWRVDRSIRVDGQGISPTRRGDTIDVEL
ncbi:hypothetical protein K227x_42440 [Rubripirellula lacrimiformis]|uniref:Uncharacterized protein n=1 Tax=Rubripirellula lacrimiformis TaxID=1930273 RepID=A0A517NFC7_9BACT|nr:hypothetical protein [Rubripirellula lacrimiformis]QDT05839.1 hypothetical protein K227x_42440 [Rubripirellula lacrimiformis]